MPMSTTCLDTSPTHRPNYFQAWTHLSFPSPPSIGLPSSSARTSDSVMWLTSMRPPTWSPFTTHPIPYPSQGTWPMPGRPHASQLPHPPYESKSSKSISASLVFLPELTPHDKIDQANPFSSLYEEEESLSNFTRLSLEAETTLFVELSPAREWLYVEHPLCPPSQPSPPSLFFGTRGHIGL